MTILGLLLVSNIPKKPRYEIIEVLNISHKPYFKIEYKISDLNVVRTDRNISCKSADYYVHVGKIYFVDINKRGCDLIESKIIGR